MCKTLECANRYKQFTTKIRREIHKNPELSFKEFETSQIVKEELENMGVTYQSVLDTGIVAQIEGAYPGKTLALRADMDALEVEEKTDITFKSQNINVMHACGHDAHTASLLTAIKILNDSRERLHGKVKFIFQPGEETVLGAPRMMQANPFMEEVDAIFAIHLDPSHPAGEICVRDGGFMFAGEKFIINIEGKNGHGAQPQTAVDALLVASAIVMNAQAILSRETDPRESAVVTICTCSAGTCHNIIAGSATMTGTYRCYSVTMKEKIKEYLNRIVENTAKTFRAHADVSYEMYVPPVVNDYHLGKIVRESVAKIVLPQNVIEVAPMTGSDDMAYYMERVPGYYALIGSGSKNEAERFPSHSEHFYVNEDCLPIAAATYAQFALDYLNQQ